MASPGPAIVACIRGLPLRDAGLHALNEPAVCNPATQLAGVCSQGQRWETTPQLPDHQTWWRPSVLLMSRNDSRACNQVTSRGPLSLLTARTPGTSPSRRNAQAPRRPSSRVSSAGGE
jgi:hypothetical protein